MKYLLWSAVESHRFAPHWHACSNVHTQTQQCTVHACCMCSCAGSTVAVGITHWHVAGSFSTEPPQLTLPQSASAIHTGVAILSHASGHMPWWMFFSPCSACTFVCDRERTSVLFCSVDNLDNQTDSVILVRPRSESLVSGVKHWLICLATSLNTLSIGTRRFEWADWRLCFYVFAFAFLGPQSQIIQLKVSSCYCHCCCFSTSVVVVVVIVVVILVVVVLSMQRGTH